VGLFPESLGCLVDKQHSFNQLCPPAGTATG